MEWKYNGIIDSNNNVGFVYKITNKITNQFYIGKTTFYCNSIMKCKNTGVVIHNKKEAKWNEYWGSSEYLSKDIKKLGLKNFEKEILEIFESDEELLYAEIKYLVKDDNILNPLCYNRSLPRLYFKDGKVTVSKYKESLLEIDKIIEDYKDNLLTLKEIIKKYKISPSTLYNIIESFGIKSKGKRFDQKVMDEIKKYHYEGLNNREIGEIVGFPTEYIRYYLNNKLNINTREKDFRKERKLGLGAKPVIHKETGIIYERGAKGASEVLNIPVSQITKSLKTKQTVNGNTFIYS